MNAELSTDRREGQADGSENSHDARDSIVEVESLSEDSTVWRAKEQLDAQNVDVESIASGTSVDLSVLSLLAESQMTAVESQATPAEWEGISVASLESIHQESPS